LRFIKFWVKLENNSHIKFRAVSDISPGRFGHSSPPLDPSETRQHVPLQETHHCSASGRYDCL